MYRGVMTHIVILLTMAGIAALYALATWFGQPAMVVFLLLLPVIVGQGGLAIWQALQRQSGQSIDVPATERWSKWLTIAYLGGAWMAGIVIDLYYVPSTRTEQYLPSTATEAPQLTEREQELVTDCRISGGDSVDAVKAAYGVPYAPRKLERATPDGTAYQYHFERYGIWVFFDDRLLVSSIRLDPPFRGVVQGVAIGESTDHLRAEKGTPVRQFQGLPMIRKEGPPVFATAWAYAPASPSFVRYDILDGKVHTILAYSCAPEPGSG